MNYLSAEAFHSFYSSFPDKIIIPLKIMFFLINGVQ